MDELAGLDPGNLPLDLGTIDSGAGVALFPPDIPGDVALSSFDFSNNYLQDPVSGLYDPTGTPVQVQAVDGTQALLTNQQTFPISTEDSIAYSVVNDQPDFNPDGTGIKNSSPDAGSQDTMTAMSGSGTANAWMHGITDALTSLVKTTVAIDTIAHQKNMTQTAGVAAPIVPQGAMRAPINSITSEKVGTGSQSTGMSPLILIAGIGLIFGLGLVHG